MNVVIAILSFGGGILVALGVLAIQRARSKKRRRPDVMSNVRPVGSEESVVDGDDALVWQRSTLVDTLIDVSDLTASSALRSKMQGALSAVGVAAFSPDGARFDARTHRAVEAEQTNDPSLDGCVAATMRCGYMDGDRMLREADVVVFSFRQ
jgi:GrpE